MESSESEFHDEYSDDSGEDPAFDVPSSLKIKSRNFRGQYDSEGESSDVVGMAALSEVDEQDQKSYETIKKIIEAGQVEKLKMDECKVYLRKHGLRLSGAKETLILRIEEHICITNGGGQRRYPASSFVLNCKGDACEGDIVMFKQKVHDVANGPQGTRVVAGRIVKESYGAAKQQHTFTIEVLWSKGNKRLPPLHPLLIKGRNLYRLKTMRQKWEDEEERLKILSEKHARGHVARLHREERIEQREMRNLKRIRETRSQPKGDPLHSLFVKQERQTKQPKRHQDKTVALADERLLQQTIHHHPRTCEAIIPIQTRICRESLTDTCQQQDFIKHSL